MSDTGTASLAGRAVLVTGGGSGIGRATVGLLLAAGARVAVVDRDGPAAAAAVEGHPKAIALTGDVSSERDTERFVEAARDAFGRLDGFFANAGVMGVPGPLVAARLEDFDQVLAVNLRSVFLGLRSVGRLFVDQGCGSIVVTASIAGMRASAGLAPYGAAKAGALNLVRSAAREFGPAGVRVNALCPSATTTNFMPALGVDPDLTAAQVARVPLGRLGAPLDMARAAVWLLGDGASFVNGAAIRVDGGQEA